MSIFQKHQMKIKIKYEKLNDFDKEVISVLIKKVISQASRELKLNEKSRYELSILITDNQNIKVLNEKFRKIKKETNVLSFPQVDLTLTKPSHKLILLGDIVLSLEKIRQESKFYSKTFEDHFSHLVLHGFMHLLGFNHEDHTEAKLMEEKETQILSKLMIKNPYMIN